MSFQDILSYDHVNASTIPSFMRNMSWTENIEQYVQSIKSHVVVAFKYILELPNKPTSND